MAEPAALRHPVRYRLEASAARLAFALFKALPLDAASGAGGRALRVLGPLLPWHRRARRHLRRALPELGPARVRGVLSGMWDNLGRSLAELPQLETLTRPGRIEVVGREHPEAALALGRAVLLFSGHIGNWEVLPLACTGLARPLTVVHRRLNNPLVEAVLAEARDANRAGSVAKGPEGARQLLALIKRHALLGLLVDQKLNEGIAAPFFGRPAMTAPALASFALRYRLPVIPVRAERLAGARFRVTFHPPLEHPASGERDADVGAMTAEVNRILEAWVRERPEQWLWMHRRWPDDA